MGFTGGGEYVVDERMEPRLLGQEPKCRSLKTTPTVGENLKRLYVDID